MARMRQLISIAALGLISVGCVSQEKYTALRIERDQLAEKLGQAEASSRAATAEASTLRSQLDAFMNSRGSESALIANFQQQNAALQAQIEELNRKYAEAVARGGQGGPLPAPLANELTEFAAQNPDLVEFDAQRGMVKFKSDVTFAVGDASLTPKAREAITRFAAILNSPTTNRYELLVAGHTDSTPVNNPRTIQAGHRNNWYLSSHRAISVGEALMGQQIAANRIGVLGYADQRPVASNTSESGKAQNRRVEVLILPTQVTGAPVTAQPAAAAPKPAVVNTQPEISK
jgi:chemotaxis protein MotB